MTRTIQQSFIFVALLFVNPACAARTRSGYAAGERHVIAASSIPSGYGIQMRMEGTFEVRDNWILVTAPTGAVRTYQGRAEAWDLIVRVGLATCTGRGEWRSISESLGGRLATTIGFTRDSSMLDTIARSFVTPLQLDLGIPPGINPDKTWLTLNLAWPIEGVIASYTLHTGHTIRAGSRPVDARRTVETLCR